VKSWWCTVTRGADGAPVIYRLDADMKPVDRWNRETKTWQPIEENE
jgi:hypothetical protein